MQFLTKHRASALVIAIAILALIFALFLYKERMSPIPLTIQEANQILTEKGIELLNIVDYLTNHSDQRIYLNNHSKWPSEISEDLASISQYEAEIQEIYVSNSKTVHFKFSIIYPGKDEEGVQIQLIQELVYSESHMGTLYITNGSNVCSEYFSKIKEDWYLGNLYY